MSDRDRRAAQAIILGIDPVVANAAEHTSGRGAWGDPTGLSSPLARTYNLAAGNLVNSIFDALNRTNYAATQAARGNWRQAVTELDPTAGPEERRRVPLSTAVGLKFGRLPNTSIGPIPVPAGTAQDILVDSLVPTLPWVRAGNPLLKVGSTAATRALRRGTPRVSTVISEGMLPRNLRGAARGVDFPDGRLTGRGPIPDNPVGSIATRVRAIDRANRVRTAGRPIATSPRQVARREAARQLRVRRQRRAVAVNRGVGPDLIVRESAPRTVLRETPGGLRGGKARSPRAARVPVFRRDGGGRVVPYLDARTQRSVDRFVEADAAANTSRFRGPTARQVLSSGYKLGRGVGDLRAAGRRPVPYRVARQLEVAQQAANTATRSGLRREASTRRWVPSPASPAQRATADTMFATAPRQAGATLPAPSGRVRAAAGLPSPAPTVRVAKLRVAADPRVVAARADVARLRDVARSAPPERQAAAWRDVGRAQEIAKRLERAVGVELRGRARRQLRAAAEPGRPTARQSRAATPAPAPPSTPGNTPPPRPTRPRPVRVTLADTGRAPYGSPSARRGVTAARARFEDAERVNVNRVAQAQARVEALRKQADGVVGAANPRTPVQQQRLGRRLEAATRDLRSAEKNLYRSRKNEAGRRAKALRRERDRMAEAADTGRFDRMFTDSGLRGVMEASADHAALRASRPLAAVKVPFTRTRFVPLVPYGTRPQDTLRNLPPFWRKAFYDAPNWIRHMFVSEYGPNREAAAILKAGDDYANLGAATASEDIIRRLASTRIGGEQRRTITHWLEGNAPASQITPEMRAFAEWGQKQTDSYFNAALRAGMPVERWHTEYVYHLVNMGGGSREALRTMRRVMSYGSKPAWMKRRTVPTIREVQSWINRMAADAAARGDNAAADRLRSLEIEDDYAVLLLRRAQSHHRALADFESAKAISRRFGTPNKDGATPAGMVDYAEVDSPFTIRMAVPDDVARTLGNATARRDRLYTGPVTRWFRKKNSQVKNLYLFTTGYHFRNQFGDMISLAQEGMNPFAGARGIGPKVGPRVSRAARAGRYEARRDDPARMLGGYLGLRGSGLSTSDIDAYLPRSGGQMAADAGGGSVARVGRGWRRLGDFRESANRVGAWRGQMRRGADPLEARRRVNQAVHDYADVGQVVQGLRVSPLGMPFVTWTAKNVPAQVRRFSNPNRTYQLGQSLQNIDEESDVDLTTLPSYALRSLPIGVGDSKWAFGNPVGDLAMIDPSRGFSDLAKDWLGQFGPVTSFGLEMLTNRDPRTGAPNTRGFRKASDGGLLVGGAVDPLLRRLGLPSVFREGSTVGPDGERVPVTNLWGPLQALVNRAPLLGPYGPYVGSVAGFDQGSMSLRDRAAGTFLGATRFRSGDPQQIARNIGAKYARLKELEKSIKDEMRDRKALRAEALKSKRPAPPILIASRTRDFREYKRVEAEIVELKRKLREAKERG